eukprot:7506801-Heterocapsa_arctica.AAC.1
MGWTWALFFCQNALEHGIQEGLAEVAAAVAPTSPSSIPFGGLIQDGHPCPVPGAGQPVAAVYVDNVTVIGATKADTVLGHELICKALRKRGFILHDLVEASREVGTVGIVFRGGDSRTLRPKPARSWR